MTIFQSLTNKEPYVCVPHVMAPTGERAGGGVGLLWNWRRGQSPIQAEVYLRVPTHHESQAATLLPMTEERRLALERLFARIGDVTTLPAAAQKVLKLTEDENGDAEKLREAIQGDPVLVARVLRRLNSSYYALSQKVSDLKTAIALL